MDILEEIVWCLTSDVRLPAPWGRIELQEGILESVVQLHDSRLISTSVAVVRGREDRHNIPVVGPVVPLHYELVSPGRRNLI